MCIHLFFVLIPIPCEQALHFILRAKQPRERAAKLFPAPRTPVVFRELLSSDFSRLPPVESLLAGYSLQMCEDNERGGHARKGGKGIYRLSPYFSFHTSCSRAPYDIPLGSVVLHLSLPYCVQIALFRLHYAVQYE